MTLSIGTSQQQNEAAWFVQQKDGKTRQARKGGGSGLGGDFMNYFALFVFTAIISGLYHLYLLITGWLVAFHDWVISVFAWLPF